MKYVWKMFIWTAGHQLLYSGPYKKEHCLPPGPIGVQIAFKHDSLIENGGVAWLSQKKRMNNEALPIIDWGVPMELMYERLEHESFRTEITTDDMYHGWTGSIGAPESKLVIKVPRHSLFDQMIYRQIVDGNRRPYHVPSLQALYQTVVSGPCGLIPAYLYFSYYGPSIFEEQVNSCIQTILFIRNWTEEQWAKKPFNDPEALDALCHLLSLVPRTIKYQDDTTMINGKQRIDDWYSWTAWLGHDDCEGVARMALVFGWYLRSQPAKTDLRKWIRTVLRQYITGGSFCQTSAPSVLSNEAPSGHVRATLLPAKNFLALQPIFSLMGIDQILPYNFPPLIVEATGEVGGLECNRLAIPIPTINRGYTRSFFPQGHLAKMARSKKDGVHEFYYGERLFWPFSGPIDEWPDDLLHYRILLFSYNGDQGCMSSELLSGDPLVKLSPIPPLDKQHIKFCRSRDERMPPDLSEVYQSSKILREDPLLPTDQLLSIHTVSSPSDVSRFLTSKCRVIQPVRPLDSTTTIIACFSK